MNKKVLTMLCLFACLLCFMTSCSGSDSSSSRSESLSSSEKEQQLSQDEDIDEEVGSALFLSDVKMIYSCDFEDGDLSHFSTRSPDDPTKLVVSDEFASSGNKSLCASGRQNEKNGPVLKLEGLCEPNNEYFLNFSIMQKDRTPITIGIEYTDTDGNVQTKPLLTTKKGGRWHNVKLLKLDVPGDYKSGYIYFEGGTSDVIIDNLNFIESPPAKIEYDLPSLSEVFKDAFKLGTAITPYDLTSRNTMALLEKHFNASITVGNEMKPDYVLDESATVEYYKKTGDDEHPQISFEMAKPVLEYARVNKIPMRLHTLVWHSQTPTWFFKEGYDPKGDWVTPKKMTARMENYIKAYFETITKLYPDIDFYACDVVNEAWLEDGRPRIAGDNKEIEGNSAWVKVYGDNSFIEKAFTYARKYAPAGCKLYYNDYNEYMLNKMNAIVEMAKDLKEKGIIDGIGMQSHLDVRKGSDAFPSIDMYNNALDVYSELGLDIQVTELDATVPANSNNQYFEAQAEYYKGIVEAIYNHRDSVSALIFWGISDDKSWRAYGQPLLFDRTSTAKPAFYEIIEDHLKQ